MSQRGIRITDWFATFLLGFFFCCVGMVFLTLFISFDPNEMTSTDLSDWAGLAIAMIIPIGLLDVGFYQIVKVIFGLLFNVKVDQGAKSPNNIVQQAMSADGGVPAMDPKTMQTISKGLSIAGILYVWYQRLVAVFAVLIGLAVVAFFWLPPVLDFLSGNSPFKWGFLLMLGLILVSFVAVIIYYLLFKRPRGNTNTP